jgi:hypothetical protein
MTQGYPIRKIHVPIGLPTWAGWSALIVASAFLLGEGGMLSEAAATDCAGRYEQARTILNTAYQKSLNRQQPDMERFSAGFRQAVDDLKAASCRTELIQLADYIRTERQ